MLNGVNKTHMISTPIFQAELLLPLFSADVHPSFYHKMTLPSCFRGFLTKHTNDGSNFYIDPNGAFKCSKGCTAPHFQSRLSKLILLIYLSYEVHCDRVWISPLPLCINFLLLSFDRNILLVRGSSTKFNGAKRARTSVSHEDRWGPESREGEKIYAL